MRMNGIIEEILKFFYYTILLPDRLTINYRVRIIQYNKNTILSGKNNTKTKKCTEYAEQFEQKFLN